MINKTALRCRRLLRHHRKNSVTKNFTTKSIKNKQRTAHQCKDHWGGSWPLIELLLKQLKSLFHFSWAFTSHSARPFNKWKNSYNGIHLWNKNLIMLYAFCATGLWYFWIGDLVAQDCTHLWLTLSHLLARVTHKSQEGRREDQETSFWWRQCNVQLSKSNSRWPSWTQRRSRWLFILSKSPNFPSVSGTVHTNFSQKFNIVNCLVLFCN